VRAAAQAIFASEGTAASLADIATRAGVSKGTVLRHYPTKEELVTDITLETLAHLHDQIAPLRDEPDTGMALRRLMTEILRLQERDQNFCDVVAGAAPVNARVSGAVAGIAALVDAVARRAHEKGTLRADLDGRDVVSLTNGIHHAVRARVNGDESVRDRYLSIVLGGLSD
jgi:AcrR family transcriptional regulator